MDTELYAESQKEARSRGLYSYYTGRRCPQGHCSERYSHSRECMECHRTGYAEKPRRTQKKYSTPTARLGRGVGCEVGRSLQGLGAGASGEGRKAAGAVQQE